MSLYFASVLILLLSTLSACWIETRKVTTLMQPEYALFQPNMKIMKYFITCVFDINCETMLNIASTDFLYLCSREVILDYCLLAKLNFNFQQEFI